MTVPQKGQADHLQLGDWNAICSVCGRKYKASEMVKQPDGVGTPWGGGTYVCKRDYRPRQPQDFVRGIPDKMAAPWVQPWPADGQFQRQPVINITEDTEELIVFVNVGSPSAVGVRLVIVIAENVTLSYLALDAVTTDAATVYYAEEVIINNSGQLAVVSNPDAIPVTVNNWTGGGLVSGLSFTVQPTETAVDSVITPSVKVALVNEAGEVITGFTGSIILAIGNNPGGAVLGGTLTQAAVAGVATFNDLTLDAAGTDYTLFASVAASETSVPKLSTAFDITAALIISANTSNYNVYNAYVAAFGTPPADVNLTVTVNPGVVVSATSTATAAMTWGNAWIGTPTFSLVNTGTIRGFGGQGANGVAHAVNGLPGNIGGNALELSGESVTITNGSGSIWGGGGGGGSGGGGQSADGGGGGGGGGVASGLGGSDGGDGANAGTAANTVTPGTGGAGGIAPGEDGGAGGAGGDYGAVGTAGTTAPGFGTGGAAGAAGKAINLTGGAVSFISGSGSPNVKGVVS